ncbi:MAG: methyltransferase family protein [Alphaproteobacteria bacterium]
MELRRQFKKEGDFLFKYRSFLPLVLLAFGLVIFAYRIIAMPNIEHSIYETSIYELSCALIALLGLAIRVYTIGYVAPKTSGRNTTQQIAETVNTTGIYSMVRHPLYLGNFFMWLGVVLFVGNIWFAIVFALAYWLYYERIMYAEEQFLTQKFGEQYLQWAEKTPAFIPNFKQFKPAEGKFNWRKVFIQEKNGLLAIFVILTSLEIFEMLWTKNYRIDGDEYIFFAGIILALIFYTIFKIVKIKDRQAH